MTRSLASDTRGAVMVMAVFMAMIAIGSLYFLVGLGDAVVAQERMQDAADATAFSAAVIHARGMNVIALINILMASLLAILVLFAMLSSIFSWAAKIAAGAAILIFPLGAAVGPLETLGRTFQVAEKSSKVVVQPMITTLSKLHGPLGKVIPVMASLNALTMSREHYAPVVEAGVTFPMLGGLPTVKGDFDTVCKKAGQLAGTMAALPLTAALDAIPGGTARNYISKKIKRQAQRLGATYAKFYCGGGKMPDPPSASVEMSFPEINTEAYLQCRDASDGDSCEKSNEELKYIHGAYDADEAICQNNSTHPRDEGKIDNVKTICDRLRVEARDTCHPSKGKKELHYTWSERTYTRRYRVIGKGLRRRVAEVVLTESEKNRDGQVRKKEVKSFRQSPCPVSGGLASNAFQTTFSGKNLTTWNMDTNKPLCATKDPKPSVGDFTDDSQTIDVEIYEVTDVLSCVQKKKVEGELKGEAMKESDKQGKKPAEMCSCAALGEDLFQVRALVYGDPETMTRDADRKILVATKGRKASEGIVDTVGGALGHFAIAQAEFYYDDTDKEGEDDEDGADGSKPEEWLWNMKWKARMRRVRLSESKWECPKEENTCEKSSVFGGNKFSQSALGALDQIKGLAGNADSVIVH